MAAETLLTKMNLQNYQVHTFTHCPSLQYELWIAVLHSCCHDALEFNSDLEGWMIAWVASAGSNKGVLAVWPNG